MKGILCASDGASDDVIPLKFHLHSGVRNYAFRINNRRFYGDLSAALGWPCDVSVYGQWHGVYLPFREFPAEVEALAILSSLNGETEREGRYIRIHSAYEAVVTPRDPDVSALRHLLAHAVTQLTRQKVRDSLLRRFGSLSVNLRDYYHQKEFYRCIGQMLIEIEEAIYERVASGWERLTPRPSSNLSPAVHPDLNGGPLRRSAGPPAGGRTSLWNMMPLRARLKGPLLVLTWAAGEKYGQAETVSYGGDRRTDGGIRRAQPE